jgi:hypothetical protein
VCVYIYVDREREREYLKENEAVERTRGIGEVVAERVEELLPVGDVELHWHMGRRGR